MEAQSSMTKFFILSLLAKREMHGYELMTELSRMLGKRPSPSQVYPVLRKLQTAGYLLGTTASAGKKNVKTYRITPTGRKLFVVISRRFDIIIAAALREKIRVCAHCNCEILSGSVQKRFAAKLLDFCCTSCAGSFHPSTTLPRK